MNPLFLIGVGIAALALITEKTKSEEKPAVKKKAKAKKSKTVASQPTLQESLSNEVLDSSDDETENPVVVNSGGVANKGDDE